ncbi:ATP-binding cassette domain-containing protein, partial [Escherichia coli]|uniref:ABC transporter ATP-binding protein n=1 Tax=Escherichia coli TaxID=562 RepID=UPI00128F0054
IHNNTILENISMPLVYTNMNTIERKNKVMTVLSAVGLDGKGDFTPSKLSGGQPQRVAIARAIINNPKFIIADEPTGALDSDTSKIIMDIFTSLNRDNHTTIILVTHDRKVAEKADRIIHILDGRIQHEEVIK